MNLEFIFKVIDKDEWQKAKQSGTYGGSEKDLKDGYIHFSEEDQVEETLNKHYPKKENLVLLRVNAFKLEHLLWEQASNGDMYPHLYSPLDTSTVVNEYDDWQDNPMSCLALVILFDQFSRNMFRNDKKAFAQDQKTRLIVNDAVYSGYLEAMNVNQRLFMLLPLIHSEEISDHEMAYYLLNKYLREHEGYNEIKKFWQDHTKAIRQFHRYPHRNEILGRESTEEEIEFLKGPNSSW